MFRWWWSLFFVGRCFRDVFVGLVSFSGKWSNLTDIFQMVSIMCWAVHMVSVQTPQPGWPFFYLNHEQRIATRWLTNQIWGIRYPENCGPVWLASLKLTVCTWKWMVGIRLFPVGMAYFQVLLLLVSGSVIIWRLHFFKNWVEGYTPSWPSPPQRWQM